jgi:hypothetical protein
MDKIRAAWNVVKTSFCATTAMRNSTTTIAIVSAEYCHASPRTKIKPIKMDRQNVLFMDAAPSNAVKDTVIVFRVFFAA